MSYRVELARSADKELWRLPEPYRTKIFKLIKALGEEPRPNACKKLKGTKDAWRVRFGPYRVLYTVEDVLRIVRVESVGARKDVYK